jgi:hypothetical protein
MNAHGNIYVYAVLFNSSKKFNAFESRAFTQRDKNRYVEILRNFENEYKINDTFSESRRKFPYSAINNSAFIRIIKKRKRKKINMQIKDNDENSEVTHYLRENKSKS